MKLDKKIETDWIIDAATGKSMGTYSIDTNGLVTMNFTGIGSGAAFDGKLTFKAKADLATATGDKISFGNNMELQVTKKTRTSVSQKALQRRAYGAIRRATSISTGRSLLPPKTVPAARWISGTCCPKALCRPALTRPTAMVRSPSPTMMQQEIKSC